MLLPIRSLPATSPGRTTLRRISCTSLSLQSDQFSNDNFSCKYEGWNDLKSMLINNVRDQRDNGVALYEHFGMLIGIRGFDRARYWCHLHGLRLCWLQNVQGRWLRLCRLHPSHQGRYFQLLSVLTNLDGATMSGWIVALIVVVVVGLAIWLYFRRQKKVALEDNFTLMEEKANKF